MNLPLQAPGLTLPTASPRFINLYSDVAAQDAQRAGELTELVAGLMAPQAVVSPKYFYDALGSKLFEAITALDEYYPTRTEAGIFDTVNEEIAAVLADSGVRHPCLIDLGAGNCAKASRLIPYLQPRQYVPVDISVEFLRDAAEQMQNTFPALDIVGIGMDFSAGLVLPDEVQSRDRVFFYPGSSLGNFTPEQALPFLRNIADANEGGARGLLLGIDLVKDHATLQAAYDDALGVTAAFNKNMLLNLNGLLGSDFDIRQWTHVAVFNAALSRVEMHLESDMAQTVRWPGGERTFAAGERIHTECSYKYTVETMRTLLAQAGFTSVQHWTDDQGWFGVFWATV